MNDKEFEKLHPRKYLDEFIDKPKVDEPYYETINRANRRVNKLDISKIKDTILKTSISGKGKIMWMNNIKAFFSGLVSIIKGN